MMEHLYFAFSVLIGFIIIWALLGICGYAMLKFVLITATEREYMLYGGYIRRIKNAPEHNLLLSTLILGPISIAMAVILLLGRV